MKNKKVSLFFKCILQPYGRIIPAILAGDLLHLYYHGSWYDPSKFIELIEVTVLYLIIILSVYWTVYYFRHFKAEG